ncbi:WGR domain-containing protein [Bradyrhizobium sp. B120]|uniref:WGR domain-containing protein n=1 Tax=Bradyrhizobium sp. B120 TaxID=3410088 RepID=UPI003B986F14
MTAIMLTRTDSRRNVARFYKLDVQSTLFGECSLVREWGRIGRAGTVRIETYRSRGPADIAVALNRMRKLKRGYRYRNSSPAIRMELSEIT